MNTKLAWRTAMGYAATSLLMFCSTSQGAVGLVASVDPLLGAPILYDSGVPIPMGGFGNPTLDATLNGGLTISSLEVLGPGLVYTTTDDGWTGPFIDDTSLIQLNVSAGPTTNVPVGPLVPFAANARGYDLTLNPASGFLGVAGAFLAAPAPMPGIFELDPAGLAPVAPYALMTARPTTSGLTYGAGSASATVSTDGVPGGAPILPIAGGIYTVPAGGPELPGILDAIPVPGGVASPGDDHVVTLDGRTIFLNDGAHDLHDVSGGAGAVALMIDLDLVAGVAPFLSLGGVRGAVNPVDGDIFSGWGLGGPMINPGGSNLIRVDDFGAGASVAVVGLDNVRDVDFGPSTLGVGPGTTGFSLYITEVEGGPSAPFGAPWSNIWEVPILVPEPTCSLWMGLLGLLGLNWVARRRRGR